MIRQRKFLAFLSFSLLTVCIGIAQDNAPAALALKPDLARGKAIFENTCAECHDGYSKEERGGPGLQGMREGKLPDGNKVDAEKLLDIINRGPAEMPSFKDRLTEQQKADVVAFALTL